MPYSWREGCPVPVEDLRLVSVTYWGFDDKPHNGQLVVHRAETQKILRTMQQLLDQRFPIDRMELIDKYRGDDDRSMEANNTSAFNCREVEGKPGSWSEHAYGRAIDINPVQNPHVSRSGEISPPGGAAYADRSERRKGMIHAGDPVVLTFRRSGWQWGGNWSGAKDYQHFSATGR